MYVKNTIGFFGKRLENFVRKGVQAALGYVPNRWTRLWFFIPTDVNQFLLILFSQCISRFVVV